MEQHLTHAGGVVFRNSRGERLFLVVSSSDGISWVLPKGHIEPGESPEQAALREIVEEAGIVGEVVEQLSVRNFIKNGQPALIQYFLIRELGTAAAKESRVLRWENNDDALELLTYAEAKAALVEGVARLRSFEQPDKTSV
jgi:8-oxo-dGTP pyrophosphatase MutT (NUDIX family)